MKFTYEGFDRNGKLRKGSVDANDLAEARTTLDALGVKTIKLKKSQDLEMPWANLPPSLKDRALFTQQFGQLIGGSVPLVEALTIASRSVTNKQLRTAVERLSRRVAEGESIADELSRKEYANSFDPVFVAFIRMGVESGNISQPIRELGEMYKWQLRITGMVKKALTLPSIILVACIGVVYYIMGHVVPTFMDILKGLNAPLPPLTAAVKSVSEVASNPLFTLGIVGVIAGLVYALFQYRKTPAGRYNIDLLTLKAPVLGPLMRTFVLARLSRGIAVMMGNSIPLNETLTIAANIANNEVYRRHILTIRSEVEIGEQMYPVMAAAPKDWPEQFWRQFRAGEEKKNLQPTLLYLGDMYNDEVTMKVEGLTTAIEPILMIFLGGMVGMILMAVFLPMTTMMNSLMK